MTYRPTHTLVPLRDIARLNRAMKVRDLNAAELADIVGTTRQTISNLRNGRTRATDVKRARAIADALHLSPNRLFDMTDADDEDEVAVG